MRQNDLHKWLFLLLMGQPTKNGNVFMGKGVGKLHPLFLLYSEGDPCSEVTFVQCARA